jgi:3-hydroxybutyryl-CoA dehydrogenase
MARKAEGGFMTTAVRHKTVLVLGEADDPLVRQMAALCQQCGYEAIFYEFEDESSYWKRLPEAFQWVINCCYVDVDDRLSDLPDEILELIDDKTLWLNSCLGGSAAWIANHCPNPEHAIGFSPIGLYTGSSTVEITQTPMTKTKSYHAAKQFLVHLGLTLIEVPDLDGLILARTLAMLVNEASSALMEGVATPEAIDQAMKLGTNYPQGPLAWADQIGLDVIYSLLLRLKLEFGERYAPTLLLSQMVMNNQLGVKVGQGFYTYSSKKPKLSLISR